MTKCIINEVCKLRMEKGVTQEELAQYSDVSRQTISALEKGNYTPSVVLAIKIARYFKVSVEKIFYISHEK